MQQKSIKPSKNLSKPRILLVDDDKTWVESFTFRFKDYYEVIEANNSSKARELIKNHSDIFLIIIDVCLNPRNKQNMKLSMNLISWFKKGYKSIPVILASGIKNDGEILKDFYQLGIEYYFLDKRLEAQELEEWRKVFDITIEKSTKGSIFISHSSEDKGFLKVLIKWLESNKRVLPNQIWLDEKNMNGGDKIQKNVSDAINNCKFFVLVISPDSVKSKYVKRELELAVDLYTKNKIRKIIPIIYRKCECKEYEDFIKSISDLLVIDLTEEIDNITRKIEKSFLLNY